MNQSKSLIHPEDVEAIRRHAKSDLVVDPSETRVEYVKSARAGILLRFGWPDDRPPHTAKQVDFALTPSQAFQLSQDLLTAVRNYLGDVDRTIK